MISITYRGQTIDDDLARLTGSDGLDASSAEVLTEEYAVLDGAKVTGTRLGRREIVLTYAIVGDPDEARARLRDVFRAKASATLEISTKAMTVVTEAYVSRVEYDLWSRRESVDVHLVCPDPWLYAKENKVFNLDTGSTTQWTVSNAGAEAGFVCQVGRSGYVRIAGQTPKLQWDASAVLSSTDVLTLDTREGHRDLYIESGGVRTSYIGYITEWNWPMIPHLPTVGYVRTTAGAGTLTVRERWVGV